jgi:hypothetical protein
MAMTQAPPASSVMPDFSHAAYGFHHTVDSALEVLAGCGVSPSRITLRMAGRGWPTYWVVGQSPPPGAPLGPDASIALSVAGLGFFHHLPTGMWDKGSEAEPGTQEILEILDDPIQKAAFWIRQGARLFDVSPDDPGACSRWISLFGLTADDWPPETWYKLALLLPSLHRIAGRVEGVKLALELLLDLPLYEIRKRRSYSYLEDSDLSLLGWQGARLGVDCIVGDRMEDLARLIFVIGPVTLSTYYEYQKDEGRRRLEAVLRLCAACHQNYSVDWRVLHPERPPRLGLETENARLGVNSHLGSEKPAWLARARKRKTPAFASQDSMGGERN